MPGQPRPHLHYDRGRLWENHHQNVRFTPGRYYDVWNFWDDNSSPTAHKWEPGLRAIQWIVQEAEQSADKVSPVRAFGGGWSLSEAAETSGFLLNTKPLNIIEVGIRPENCAAEFLNGNGNGDEGGNPGHLVFAQCGASIAELSRELENRGLSLPTSGASNGQTICGAMSTGTHGSAYQLENGGSVQDYILGVHLVGPGGEHSWIERASHPVVNQSFCDVLGTALIRNDDLFDAVRVSFGSFGIIHAVLLQAVPIFLLERHVCPVPFESVLPVLGNLEEIPQLRLTDINGRIPKDLPFHFEVLLNPYALSFEQGKLREKTGSKGAYVRYMFKRPLDLSMYSPTHGFMGRKPEHTTLSNDAFGLIGKLANVATDVGAIEWALGKALNGERSDNGADQTGTILTHGGTFDATQIPGHSLSCELGVAIANVPTAVEVIVKTMQVHPFACPPALRYVKPSSAFLAFTKFAPYTCTIEFPTSNTPRSLRGYEHVWSALDKARIPYTFHWGQCLRYEKDAASSLERLRNVFDNGQPGGRVDRWLAVRRTFLPTKKARMVFSNQMLCKLGLAD